MFSKTRSQAFQRLFKARFDVLILSYNVKKQTIYKKKKIWLNSLSFLNTKSILAKANVSQIIDNYYDLV
jgi:hypothetical protein